MKIRLLAVCKNEEKILPYFLNHYLSFCDQIVIYDNYSTDKSVEIIKSFPNTKVEYFDTDGKMDDVKLTQIRNEGWKQDKDLFDWQIVVDIDQFLYHPNMLLKLMEYKAKGITIPKIIGFEMGSLEFPTENKQIYEIIKTGKRSHYLDLWTIFNPQKININLWHGCQICYPEGETVYSEDSDIKLLHYSHLSYDYFINKNIQRENSRSEINKKMSLSYHYAIFSKMTEEEYNQKINMCGNVIDEEQQSLKEKDGHTYGEIFETNVYGVLPEEVKNKTIIDVGANRGYFSILAMNMGAKRCFTFEPNINMYHDMVENTCKYEYIYPKNIAVFNKNTNEIEISDDNVCSSVFNNPFSEQKEKKTLKCPSVSLDSILEKIDEQDLVLKMDCEGSEFEILFNTSYENFKKINTIYIEIHGKIDLNYTQDMLLGLFRYLGYKQVGHGPCWGMWYTNEDGTKRFDPFPLEVFKFSR